jgi:hypothetical protein
MLNEENVETETGEFYASQALYSKLKDGSRDLKISKPQRTQSKRHFVKTLSVSEKPYPAPL